jgi:hypothetical protein
VVRTIEEGGEIKGCECVGELGTTTWMCYKVVDTASEVFHMVSGDRPHVIWLVANPLWMMMSLVVCGTR